MSGSSSTIRIRDIVPLSRNFRQVQDRADAFTRLAMQLQRSAVGPGHVARQRKAEPHLAGFGGEERVESGAQVLFLDAGPGIGDLQALPAAGPGDNYGDL